MGKASTPPHLARALKVLPSVGTFTTVINEVSDAIPLTRAIRISKGMTTTRNASVAVSAMDLHYGTKAVAPQPPALARRITNPARTRVLKPSQLPYTNVETPYATTEIKVPKARAIGPKAPIRRQKHTTTFMLIEVLNHELLMP